MIRLHDIAHPGIMISQTWPRSGETEGATLAAVETALREDFFTAFQTVEIPYAGERKQIASVMGSGGYPLTYCVARVLNKNRLNLSDLDEANRKRSYERVINLLDDAREAGASAVSFVSGPRPDDLADRPRALDCLRDSMERIAPEAAKSPAIHLLAEPLDTDAHKRATLGTTAEAVTLCRDLKAGGLDLSLCVDTAHVVLNGEDPLEVLGTAKAYTEEFHFCNCVTDRAHPLFGDNHIPFGEPGFLDIPEIARMMRAAVGMGFLSSQTRPVILCEVLKRDQDDSEKLLVSNLDAMKQAWAMASEDAG